MNARFVIFVETAAGEVIRAFTWSRDAASGIARAKKEAIMFGLPAKKVWAEEVN